MVQPDFGRFSEQITRMLEGRGALLVDLANGLVTELGRVRSRPELVAAAYAAESEAAVPLTETERTVRVGRVIVARVDTQLALVAEAGDSTGEDMKITMALSTMAWIIARQMQRLAAEADATSWVPPSGGTPPSGAPAEARVIAPGRKPRLPS